MEALGKPKNPLDEWKRTYSNEETREVAIPWFWKNQYDPEEWSLWKVDYKYNDELTLTFMSNNLVGGFFNRLSASTKYMFGCMVVYGETTIMVSLVLSWLEVKIMFQLLMLLQIGNLMNLLNWMDLMKMIKIH